ncbi:hypothetical protein LCGC14_1897950 [marine sediment metagenome]|uniref:Uncharacterized protein n=1 Tax=marine sediment metagenome TaxID=412755 RepID=A0A0F9FXG2_9ZZZZ
MSEALTIDNKIKIMEMAQQQQAHDTTSDYRESYKTMVVLIINPEPKSKDD